MRIVMQPSRCLVFVFGVLLLALANSVTLAKGQTAVPNAQAAEALQRARAAYRQKDFAKARKEIQRARELQKDWAEPVLLEALISWQEGKSGEAIKSARETLRLQPNHQTAHYLLGRLLFESSKYDEALAEVKAALDGGAKFADIYVLLGDIEIIRQKSKEALAAYETALQQPAPKNEITPEFHLRLAAIHNMREFFQHKDDPRYERPKILGRPSRSGVGGVGKISLAGIVTEQGLYTNVIIISADVGIRGKEGLLEIARQYQFSPAKKDGTPVPFWFYFSYSQDTMIHR